MFKIDFFELMILTSHCYGNQPIARSMFFDNISDNYYHSMTKNERIRMFKYITDDSFFDKEIETNKHFIARFNPDNQYLIKTKYKKKEEEIECYKYNGDYHTKKNKYIAKEYIISINHNLELDGTNN